MGEWLYHRTHGVGEVLDRDGRVRVVRFSDGRVRTVDSRYRPLAETSLEVRAHRDPASFREWIGSAPGEAAVELLRNHPNGLDDRQVVRQLRDLGLPEGEATTWWSEKAAPLLRERPDVAVSRDLPERFTLRQSPDPRSRVAEATEILERLARKRTTSDQRTRLAADLRQLNGEAELPLSIRGAAAALGASLPDAPPLADVDPADLPADVVRQMLQQDDPVFLTRAAVDGRGQVAAEAAERCVDSIPLTDRARHAATVCVEAVQEIEATPGDELNSTAERLANRVRQLRRLVADGTTPALVAEVLHLIHAVSARRSDDKQLARLRDMAEACVVVEDGSPDALAAALRLDRVRELPDAVLSVAWSNERIAAPDSTRVAWLRAVARERARVLADPRAWQGVVLDDLQILAEVEETRRWLFDTATGRERFASIARAGLRRMDRAALGRLIAGSGAVLERLPGDPVHEALGRLADTDPSLQVISDGFAAARLEDARRQFDEEMRTAEDRYTEALRRAQEGTAQAELRAAQLAREADLARRLVQSTSVSAMGSAELRQARLDGLRVAADILSEVERAATRNVAFRDLGSRLRAIAEANGLRREAEAGTSGVFDHRRHRPVVEAALADGTEVTVVEPAWLTGDGDDVTAVRYGLVRGRTVSGSEEGDDRGRDDAGSRLRDDDDAGSTGHRPGEHNHPGGDHAAMDADAGGGGP